MKTLLLSMKPEIENLLAVWDITAEGYPEMTVIRIDTTTTSFEICLRTSG